MADEAIVESHVIAIHQNSVAWAVDELSRLDPEQLGHLKIRSGEHLAAILLTSFLRIVPTRSTLRGAWTWFSTAAS
jgi:hypothetical protein